MNQVPQPFGELDLIRFMFELHRQPIDATNLQQMMLDHRMRTQPPQPHIQHYPISPMATTFSPHTTNVSTPNIPEPKVIFNYVPQFPTPAATPEAPESEIISTTPDTTAHLTSDDESENEADERLKASQKLSDWCGNSIYANMPDVAMLEYDKILRESHAMKSEVIEKLHSVTPINYDYNPNKSRIRTNYEDPSIAEGRTKNNIASRRSRQRKKFQQQIVQYSVDYEQDENFLLQKEEKWLRAIIENLEEKFLAKEGEERGREEIGKLRKQCGFN